MEKFQEARAEASKRLLIADHMASLTYPLVRDSRLLVAITENLFLSLSSALASILYYERTFKRIPPFHDNIDSKLFMFKEEVRKAYNLDPAYITLITDVKELLLAHKESPVEFSRNDSLVVYSNNYQSIKTFTIDALKPKIRKAKQFLKDVEAITGKDEGIFSRSKRRA